MPHRVGLMRRRFCFGIARGAPDLPFRWNIGRNSPVRAHLGGAASPQRERVRYFSMSRLNVLPVKYSSMVWRSLPRVT